MKRLFSNLNTTAIKRYLVRYILKKYGIANILLILRFKENVRIKQMNNEYSLFIAENNNDLAHYKISDRLVNRVHTFFKHGSRCVCIAHGNKIIAFSWFHHNYDANNDLQDIGINDYTLIGPTYVDPKYRGNKLKQHMNAVIVDNVNTNNIICVNSFDNISSVKANYKTGFRLYKIKYKLYNENMVIET